MAARNGLNCILSYLRGGATHSYRVRAGSLGFGVQMVATESAARIIRSYYPHRTANQRFTVQILLKDWNERTDFTRWLYDYASWALDPDIIRTTFPYLTVNIPRRQFYQRGLPLQGYEWGAHTGMMMFTPTVVFEAAFSPGQSSPAANTSTVINRWSAFGSDPAIKYFYPFGTQLKGDAGPQPPQPASVISPPSPTPPPAGPTPQTGSLFQLPTGDGPPLDPAHLVEDF